MPLLRHLTDQAINFTSAPDFIKCMSNLLTGTANEICERIGLNHELNIKGAQLAGNKLTISLQNDKVPEGLGFLKINYRQELKKLILIFSLRLSGEKEVNNATEAL